MDKTDKKDFKWWIVLKEKLHNIGKPRFIREGDVWWFAAGENIRTEMNSKSKRFSRPILVVKNLVDIVFGECHLYHKNTMVIGILLSVFKIKQNMQQLYN